MQRWEMAARRYAEICPEPGVLLIPSTLSNLRTWLEDDVIPVLSDVTRLPRFRDLATFSLRMLARGTDSNQRRAVERVDRGLIEAAQAILALVNHAQIRTRLGVQDLPQAFSAVGVIEVSNQIDRRTPTTTSIDSNLSCSDLLASEIGGVQCVARRDWDDLVCASDYFSTRQEFVEAADGTRLQRGELINSLNARLLPIGDLVARSLRRRIDVRSDMIRTLGTRTRQVLADAQFGLLDERNCWIRAEHELNDAIRALEALVFADADAILRDSCVILTQVYASIHPAAELDWLGLGEELVGESRGRFPSLLRGHRGSTIHDRIARAIQDMGQLYRGIDPSISHLDRAIASGGLVIHEPSQSAWWDGDQINFGNSTNNFNFLAALARKACRTQAVTETDLYPDDSPSTSTMGNRWNRLGRCLPGSLAQLIQPGALPRSYRLLLEAQRILVIRE